METYLLCTDHEKAFDSTQRHILFDILKSINIPDIFIKGNSGHIHTKQNINKI